MILADGVPPALARPRKWVPGLGYPVVILADGVPPALGANTAAVLQANGIVVILADGVPPALGLCRTYGRLVPLTL